MNNCPLCGNARLQTIVDCADKPPRGEPVALCWFPVYVDHDPTQPEPCGKVAVIADAMFPVEWAGNRCAEHLNAKEEFCPDI